MLVSPQGGERRFAAAVAKRLESLGALTQGDRNSTVGAKTMSLAAFNFETVYGFRALRDLYSLFERTEEKLPDLPSLDPHPDLVSDVCAYLNSSYETKLYACGLGLVRLPGEEVKPEKVTFSAVACVHLRRVGIDLKNASKDEPVKVKHFLNRLLGIETRCQSLLFEVCFESPL